MQKFYYLLIIFCFIAFEVKAQSQYPNLSGEIYMESKIGFINSESNANTYSNSGIMEFEPRFSLNINEEWSIKTRWNLSPLRDRDVDNYEIGNVFPSDNYPDNINDYGLVVEELKGDFRNDDLNFFFGKYNPTFGEAWKKKKRIGVFVTDFTRDYELREKLGLGASAILDEDGAITFNTFFNDTTAMSNSAFNNRGKNKSSNNIAGNNTNLSSYSITASGNNLLDVDDLRYNFGYRDLDTENAIGYDNEKAFVGGLEYTIPLNYKTYFVPFAEIVKINNFNGLAGQDILYTTLSLTLKYSNWHAGISGVVRDIDRTGSDDYTDRQSQYFVGYKFNNGINLDVAHLDVKESNNKAKMVGVALSYLYEF